MAVFTNIVRARALPAAGIVLGLGVVLLVLHSRKTAPVVVAPVIAHLDVEGPRPVAHAIDELTSRYGYFITYEDPRFTYAADIKSAAPLGGALSVSYPVAPGSGEPVDAAALIRRVLETQAAGGSGGVFRLQQSGGQFHVTPSRVRDGGGDWIAHGSVLDVRISIPEGQRTIDQMLQLICAAVTTGANVRVELGASPSSVRAFTSGVWQLGARNEVARDVLLRTLGATKRQIVWQLLYQPDVRAYSLNLRLIPAKAP
jgi:hypothetical protein